MSTLSLGINGEDRMHRMEWTQDELNEIWQMLQDSATSIHKIVHNDDTAQTMEVHSPQISTYGNDSESVTINISYGRTRRGKDDEWGLWEKH